MTKHWSDYEQIHPSEGHCSHCHKDCTGGLQYRSVGAIITHSHVNGPPDGRYTIVWNMRDGEKCPLCEKAKAIKARADEVWAQIEAMTFNHYGATEPGSVDPELAMLHAGLIEAWNMIGGKA